jgi:hypothetical protein
VDFLFGKDPFSKMMWELVLGICFLVSQGSLLSCHIISKCGKDSLMFHNLFLIRIPFSFYLQKEPNKLEHSTTAQKHPNLAESGGKIREVKESSEVVF